MFSSNLVASALSGLNVMVETGRIAPFSLTFYAVERKHSGFANPNPKS